MDRHIVPFKAEAYSSGTVMVVEDGSPAIHAVASVLDKAGLRVRVIHIRESLLAAAQTLQPDLIIVHPDEQHGGAEFICQLKAHPQLLHTPLLVITTQAGVIAATKHLVGSTDDILHPAQNEEILPRVHALLAVGALTKSQARYRELWEQAQTNLSKTEALYRVNRSLTAIRDLSGLLQAVVDSVAEALPANRVVLFTLDADQRQVLREVRGGPGKDYVIDIPFEELWEGLSGWVMREMKPALSGKLGKDARESQRVQRRRVETHCGAILVVPLFYQDKLLGTMTAINCPDERDFNQDDVELMITMASQAAAAIENASLYDALQRSHAEMEQRVDERTAELAQANASLRAENAERRRAEQALQAIIRENSHLFDQTRRRAQALESLAMVSSALRQAQTSDEMFKILVEKSLAALSGDAGVLYMQRGNNLEAAAVCGLEGLAVGAVHSLTYEPYASVIHTGEPVIIDGQDGAQGLCPCALCQVALQGMAAGVMIPLSSAESSIGLLHLGYRSSVEIHEEQRYLLAAITEMAGNALHRALVMNTLEQRVNDRTRELSALYDITTVASESIDLQTMLERALARVLSAMVSIAGAIHLLSGDDKKLSLAAWNSTSPPRISAGEASMPFSLLAGWVIQHSGPLVIPNLATDPRTPAAAREMGSYAYAGVSMQARGQVLGVLSILRELRDPFNIEEVAMLSSIADQIAVAVENARLRQLAEQAAVVEERARLARELHDSVTQSLYGLTLLAEGGRQIIDAGNLDLIHHNLARIVETAHQALKEMRLLVYELRPPALEQVGLIVAINQRLEAVERRTGIKARLVTHGPVDLPAPVDEALFRIAQEGLNNALNHSQATSIEVYLCGDERGVELRIVDDGCGFNLDKASQGGGLGLTSMRERAEKIGGRFEIRSTSRCGTTLSVYVENRRLQP